MNATEYYPSESDIIDRLNDIYGDIDVCGMTYGAGDILAEVDPTALRCMVAEATQWQCSECDEVHDAEGDAEECCKPEEEEEGSA